MNDVIPACGGYLVVRIDKHGYILNYEDDDVIHRETRDLDERYECFPSFAAAKNQLAQEWGLYADPHELALLELTSEGGGAALWMREEQIPELSARRDKFKGCYGSWTIHALSL